MPTGRRRAWAWGQLLGAVPILAQLVGHLGPGPAFGVPTLVSTQPGAAALLALSGT